MLFPLAQRRKQSFGSTRQLLLLLLVSNLAFGRFQFDLDSTSPTTHHEPIDSNAPQPRLPENIEPFDSDSRSDSDSEDQDSEPSSPHE